MIKVKFKSENEVFQNVHAEFKDGVWTGGDSSLVEMLRQFTASHDTQSGKEYFADYDVSLALYLQKNLSGRYAVEYQNSQPFEPIEGDFEY
jgi:hypothetical protein